jgi:hypothetical protein
MKTSCPQLTHEAPLPGLITSVPLLLELAQRTSLAD